VTPRLAGQPGRPGGRPLASMTGGEAGRAGAFVPGGAFTGIGSLPFEDPQEAVSFVADLSPQIPFWPQLPAGDMVGAVFGHASPAFSPVLLGRPAAAGYELSEERLAQLRVAAADPPSPLTETQAPGLSAFHRAARRGAFARAQAVKGQVTGPLTLACLLRVAGSSGIARRDVVSVLAALVVKQATWQIQQLRYLHRPVLMFVDEPALGITADHPDARAHASVLRGICGAIRAAGGIAGLHCCTLAWLGQLSGVQPDIISFDALGGMTAPIDDETTRGFWSADGIMAFGLIPPQQTEPVPSTRQLFARWVLAGASVGDDVAALAGRTMVTATCGLALQSPAAAEASFRQAANLSSLIAIVAAAGGPEPGRSGVAGYGGSR